MDNAQRWLDQTYPKEERDKIEAIAIDDETKTKRLNGELYLDRFYNLIEMDLSNNDITKLDVSDCYELERIIVANNSLTNLLNQPKDIINPEKLTYLNMMNNNIDENNLNLFYDFYNLEELYIGTDDRQKIEQGSYNRFHGTLKPLKDLKKLKVLDISNTDISKGLRHLPDSLKEFFYDAIRPGAKVARIKEKFNLYNNDLKKYKKEKPIKNKILRKKSVENYEPEDQVEINNLLIVGRTGNGKSTLANVLSDTNRFKESDKSVSVTRYFEEERFMHNGKSYRVVDTIGVGDTKLSKKQVLLRIAEAVYTMKEGINQVFFVVGRRFTIEEIEAFELLKTVIFESNIIKHTTIVRTNFTNFMYPDRVKTDRQEIMEENKFLADIINSCNGIIYIDAPPINIDCQLRSSLNKEDRKKSRKILLNHIESFHGNYKPYLKTWDQLYVKIRNYIKIKYELEESLQNSSSSAEISKIKERIEKLEEKVVRETDLKCDIEIPSITKIRLCFKSKNGICQII
ncbi:1682_t:CDS:1 [Dentiscutata erythropus]|uniref:1682_t:CDS:1 n=1 Tax=Dentiscutata erythropus TaxID=1348616 RepID=A0A9N9FFZ5_9GLOM|nr:1682_t:CDS:1 [Dentiscutata erythropus]